MSRKVETGCREPGEAFRLRENGLGRGDAMGPAGRSLAVMGRA
jgi:hypothetical protein